MASATGIPETNNVTIEGVGEDEPLLGRAGDASQKEGYPIYYNLIIGRKTQASLIPSASLTKHL